MVLLNLERDILYIFDEHWHVYSRRLEVFILIFCLLSYITLTFELVTIKEKIINSFTSLSCPGHKWKNNVVSDGSDRSFESLRFDSIDDKVLL
jgi:hypothetical protein